MDNTVLKQTLIKYLPEHSIDFALLYMQRYAIVLKISRPRTTKLGDYRAPHNGKGHRISINGNLNRYAFLLTFAHELAHLIVWETYRIRIRPHGIEWKTAYRRLLIELLADEVFPEDIRQEIEGVCFTDRTNSKVTNERIEKVIGSYNTGPPPVLVQDLQRDTVFKLKNGRKFRLLHKMRKRYKCVDVVNGRLYIVHPRTEVLSLE